jgi:hypothetical protein
MSQIPSHNPPTRINELIELQSRGAAITCSAVLNIIPVDFSHRSYRFRAVVFIARFSGTADTQQYTFRKCYARGCTHDRCPRVSQAVMIANRFLQRDYHRLEQSGIGIEEKLFTLDGSLVRLTTLKDDRRETMIMDDYIRMAKGGNKISVDIALEYVPAIEHFEYHKNRQTFLMADFTVTAQGKRAECQRCLGCYPTEKEQEEKPLQIEVANDRLTHIYKEFDLSSIGYEKRFLYVSCKIARSWLNVPGPQGRG